METLYISCLECGTTGTLHVVAVNLIWSTWCIRRGMAMSMTVENLKLIFVPLVKYADYLRFVGKELKPPMVQRGVGVAVKRAAVKSTRAHAMCHLPLNRLDDPNVSEGH
jgi:hypothetical protein